MESNGLNQKALAVGVGITETSVHKYCQKGGVPEWHILLKIAKFFEVSVDYLLTGREYEAPPSNAPKWFQPYLPLLDEIGTFDQGRLVGKLEELIERQPLQVREKIKAGKAPARRAAGNDRK